MIRLHGPRVFALLTVMFCALPAFAHPGHGRDGGSHQLLHYVTEPMHIAPVTLAMVAGVAAAGIVAWFRKRA